MRKKDIARLSGEERVLLEEYIKKQRGTSSKVRRAQVVWSHQIGQWVKIV